MYNAALLLTWDSLKKLTREEVNVILFIHYGGIQLLAQCVERPNVFGEEWFLKMLLFLQNIAAIPYLRYALIRQEKILSMPLQAVLADENPRSQDVSNGSEIFIFK